MSPTNSSNSSSVSQLVSSIRKTANELKEAKHAVGTSAVNGLKWLLKPIEGYLGGLRATLSAVTSVHTCLSVAVENKSTAEAIQQLMSNFVQDSANRLNEAANIIEHLGKDVRVQQAVEDAKIAVDRYFALDKKPVKKTAKKKSQQTN